MTTIADLLRESTVLECVSDTPRLDGEVLLCHILGRSRAYLYTWPDAPVDDSDSEQFRALLHQRKQGMPVAYLVGMQEFWSLPLRVSPATLIPRPETELLVEMALALPLPENARVLDLGTGTGAISLALASERPGWRIVAVDNQPGAVTLATDNAHSLGLGNVRVMESNWFTAIEGPFDLIVSNPPYIAADDVHLREGGVRFEPRSALVAGEEGLGDLRRIVAEGGAFLAARGYLMVEHGAGQGAEVRMLFEGCGYGDVRTTQDIGGRDRVTSGSRYVAGSNQGLVKIEDRRRKPTDFGC